MRKWIAAVAVVAGLVSFGGVAYAQQDPTPQDDHEGCRSDQQEISGGTGA